MGGGRRQDHWARKAAREGHAARSVYKLDEIHQKHRVLDGARRVLDLGCAPGSWSALARKVAGAEATLVGVDLQAVPGYPGQLVEASVFDVPTELLREHLGGPADLVLSDMAPATSGNRLRDHVVQIELATRAAEIARALLRPRGHFVAKIFDGEDAPGLIDALRSDYATVKRVRPKAVRSESREFFVVGLGRRPSSQFSA